MCRTSRCVPVPLKGCSTQMKSAFAVMALLLLGRPSVSAAQKPTPARLKLNAFMDARFYSGGTRVLAVSYKGIIDIYDGRNGRRLGHFVPDQSLEPYASSAVMTKGGRTAIIGTSGTFKAMTLEVNTGKFSEATRSGAVDEWIGLSSSDDETLVLALHNKTVMLRRLPDLEAAPKSLYRVR